MRGLSRKLLSVLKGLEAARTGNSGTASCIEARRWFSQVPKEYQQFYKGQTAQRSGVARPNPRPDEPSPSSEDTPSSSAPTRVWMFPWERRQIEGAGTPLRTWEKAYWGIFVTAIALFLFSRMHSTPTPKQDPQLVQQREDRKRNAARALLAGKSFVDGEDEFDGLTPQEIQEYVAKVTHGATAEDPFEGLSPEEINDYLASQKGLPNA